MNEILKKLRFLDRILNNINNLTTELNKLHSLRIIKFKEPIVDFDKVIKILLLITNLKLTIKEEIKTRLLNTDSYLKRFESSKLYNLSNNIKYFPIKITNDYKFKLNNENEFIIIKKDIDLIIKNLPINKKKDIRSQIIDYNKYCSDYINRNINSFVLQRMNKYKYQFLIKSS